MAARGLDIPHIRNVINFDVARDIDTHTHRVGRTGRAGVKGTAYTLVTEKEKEFAGHIVRNLEAANQVNKFTDDGHIVVRRGITQPYQTISVRLVELGLFLKINVDNFEYCNIARYVFLTQNLCYKVSFLYLADFTVSIV